ncbi:LPS assembly lipoprotein LptE [Limnohabitans sp.]|mgnify:FL=1|jgi:LPS-assembly lipoprotein|uniref:LPS-assembly lipoprotein LptE n=1 Tax=Limnohabitans sp. TaxID=1907725 RepID=UPI00286F49B3|nr:LPS assembly lipoprotein LptE [Limnohabitans sp.]
MRTTRRAWLISTAFTAGLAGCGFELRKPPRYAFETLFSSIPIVSPFGVKLKRSLESSGQVEVITDGRQIERAQIIFDQLFELREKVVVGRTSTGAIREFQLRLRYRFRVRSRNGIELIPDTEILLTRDINFNETGALSKESEEALLYKDMENDLVLQLQRRLAAIRQI